MRHVTLFDTGLFQLKLTFVGSNRTLPQVAEYTYILPNCTNFGYYFKVYDPWRFIKHEGPLHEITSPYFTVDLDAVKKTSGTASQGTGSTVAAVNWELLKIGEDRKERQKS